MKVSVESLSAVDDVALGGPYGRRGFGRPPEPPRHRAEGGQIYLADVKAGTADPRPGGFNGVGPQDWYGARREQWHVLDPQPAVYASLLARPDQH